MRQRMMQEQCGLGNENGGEDGEEEMHYFDEDNDSDYEGRAIVQRDNSQKQRRKAANNSSHVVDALPADHPTSSTIQTHRLCTLCHRTLPRSQFSERDRFTINLSLSPGGATCRTCSMTVSAVRLKSLPGTEALLLEYAQRGMERGMMAISSGGVADAQGALSDGVPVAGLLESGTNLNHSSSSNALVVRKESTASGITGKELTLYGAPPSSDGLRNSTNSYPSNNSNSNGTRDIMGHQHQQPPNNSNSTNHRDINASFSTNQQRYTATDADRPNSVADCKYIDALLRMPCYLNLNAFGVFTSSKEVSVSLAALEAVRLYGTVGGEYFVPHDCDGLRMSKSENNKGGSKRGSKGGKRHAQTTEQGTAGDGINNNNVNPSSIVCLVLNEGPTPRTSILASQHYGWTTIAIDPKLDEQWMGYHDDIPNFMGYSGTINEFMDNNTSGSNNEYAETMIEFRQSKVEHLVIIGVQQYDDDANKQENELRLKSRGHVNEIRSRYDDVPTTLVSLSPVRKITLAPLQRRDGVCGSKLEKDVGYEPNCSYIDEGVFSGCRMVEVWNFHNADEEGSDEDGSEYSDEENEEEEDSYNSQSESEEEHTQRASSNKRSSESKKEKRNNNKKSGIVKKSAWLEDQVAEYKKEKKDEEDAILYNDDDTLSTKGTFDRLQSNGSTIEGVVDRMPSRGEESVEDELARKEIHQRIQQRNTQEVPNSDTEADPDSFIHGDETDHNGHDDESNSNSEVESTWSQPDENEASKVWEKAMAKHGKEESFVNQFEEYYNKSDSGGSSDRHSGSQEQQGHSSNASPAAEEGEEPNTHGLPPGWEALYDEASGEYYYNNWETGEVTWEHPIDENDAAVNNIQDNNNEEGVETMSPLEGGAEDHIHDSKPFYDSKPSAESSAAKSSYDGSNRGEKDDDVPPLCSYSQQHSNHTYSHDSFGNTSDTDSAYVFDDQSTASSGIAALSRWNKPQVKTNSPESSLKKTLGQSNQGSDEDDLIVWSDDENSNAEEEEKVNQTLERTSSGASIKQQPWHKKDSAEGMLGGGNNDSFLFD